MEAASLTAPAGLRAARGGRLLRLRTDDQLVALFRLGNDEAFRVIHDRYRSRLFAYTRQMLAGSASDAEDALQDVFIRAYGALRADDRPVTLRAWLYRVAHNRCIDHLRRPANQPTGELFENVSSLSDPLADIQRRDDLRRLVEDVARLPEQQRSALLMREMEGLTYVELADALGVTVPSVKSLLVRARIGLTEAREARDTACVEIRHDISAAHDKGVRVNGRARRHLQECEGCTDYKAQLRRVREGFAALGGGHPGAFGALLKLLGVGGAGGGAAAAGGGAAASGGGAAGGLVLAGGTAKVAALVGCAAVVGGGAVEGARTLAHRDAPKAALRATPRAVAATPSAPVTVRVTRTAAPVAADPAVTAAAAKRARAAKAAAKRDAASTISALPQATTRLRVAPEDPSLGGSSADEDAQTATQAGGMLAPEAAADPDPVTAPPLAADPPPGTVTGASTTDPATPVAAPAPSGTTGP